MSLIEDAGGMARISPKRLKELQDRGAPVELVDVRTPAEYRSLHATIARLVPLDRLDPRRFMGSREGAEHDPVYFICRSGTRSARACERFRAAGYANVIDVEGGTLAWEREGLPVVRGRWVLPLDRQVQTTAGVVALTGFILGETSDPNWFLLSGFVGLGLFLAGVTGFCPMGWLLARMPWNQAGPSDA